MKKILLSLLACFVLTGNSVQSQTKNGNVNIDQSVINNFFENAGDLYRDEDPPGVALTERIMNGFASGDNFGNAAMSTATALMILLPARSLMMQAEQAQAEFIFILAGSFSILFPM